MRAEGTWTRRHKAQAVRNVLVGIARRELGIETLEARNVDGLDFRELSVWQVRAALEAAFEAGRAAGK